MRNGAVACKSSGPVCLRHRRQLYHDGISSWGCIMLRTLVLSHHTSRGVCRSQCCVAHTNMLWIPASLALYDVMCRGFVHMFLTPVTWALLPSFVSTQANAVIPVMRGINPSDTGTIFSAEGNLERSSTSTVLCTRAGKGTSTHL